MNTFRCLSGGPHSLSVHLGIWGEVRLILSPPLRYVKKTYTAAGKRPMESFFPEWNILHRAESSHMAPVRARVEAVGGQRRGRTGPRADGSGWLWVADLWDHIIRLPALQFLPHQPLHLLPVGVGVPPQTLVLTDKNGFTCSGCLRAHKKPG